MNENTIGKIITKYVGDTGKVIIQDLNPLDILEEYISYRKKAEEQKTEREKILAQRDIAIKSIESEKEVILKYFELRFSERKEALSQLFEVLHQAIENKNISTADYILDGILGIIRENPLKDFESFRRSRISGEIIEI